MNDAFAHDDEAVESSYESPSESGVRAVAHLSPEGVAAEMQSAVNGLARVVAARGAETSFGRVVDSLRAVESATTELGKHARALGATHVTETWLEACADWLTSLAATLRSAVAYTGAPRTLTVELAVEESSMRIATRLEREGADAVAMLRNLDGNAARVARILTACIQLTDRALRALVTARATG